MASAEDLRTIHFDGELLPKWAQLLDLAARICPVPVETRSWFARFTQSSGVDDARSIRAHVETLRNALEVSPQAVKQEFREMDSLRCDQIIKGWKYSLETMAIQASKAQTCFWEVDGSDVGLDDFGNGEISLRRS